MGIFSSSDDDDGCTAHHYGDYERDFDSIHTRTRKRDLAALGLPAIEVEVPEIASCQHHGCNDTRTKREPTLRDSVVVPLVDLSKEPSDVAEQLREYADSVEEHGA